MGCGTAAVGTAAEAARAALICCGSSANGAVGRVGVVPKVKGFVEGDADGIIRGEDCNCEGPGRDLFSRWEDADDDCAACLDSLGKMRMGEDLGVLLSGADDE